MSIDQKTFRAAMSRFPAGVTIVTTTDRDGETWGFTATAFSSVSLDPPLVLVCLARSAKCYQAFRDASGYVIHIVDQRHRELALRFSSKDVKDKFADSPFRLGDFGHPELDDALVAIRCVAKDVVPAGDHIIMIGCVVDARVREDGAPLVHADRTFWHLSNDGSRSEGASAK